jgi:hypothetical protein
VRQVHYGSRYMLSKLFLAIALVLSLTACTDPINPGGLTDKEYEDFKQLGSPKILYSCTNTKEILWVIACAQSSGKTHEECFHEADKSGRLAQKVKHVEVAVNYDFGVGPGVTYNKLLTEAKRECDGEFKILESKE